MIKNQITHAFTHCAIRCNSVIYCWLCICTPEHVMVHCLVLVLSCFTGEAVRAILVTCRANDIVSTLHNIHVVDIVHPFPTHFRCNNDFMCFYLFFSSWWKMPYPQFYAGFCAIFSLYSIAKYINNNFMLLFSVRVIFIIMFVQMYVQR